MDKEIKAKWIEALRSGKYKQGTTYLRRKDDTFCCLGVLCDIIDPSVWEDDSGSGGFGYDGNTCLLPLTVGIRTGLKKERSLWMNHHLEHLVSMNDALGNSFDEIADYIEEAL